MSASVSRIPLVSTPQTLGIQLARVNYNFTVHWCRQIAAWILDIADGNDNMIVAGIPLVTGADLLAQYKYLEIGGQLIVQTSHDTDAVPLFTNLGTEANLYFIPDVSP